MIDITDGTTTISLQPGTPGTFGLKRGQHMQQISQDGNEPIWEHYELTWRELSDTSRDTQFQAFYILRDKIKRYWQHNLLGEPVYLKVQTPTEANIRYALIYDLKIDELQPAHWDAARHTGLSLQVKREPYWRGQAPLASPSLISAAASKNNYGTDAPYITISPSSLYGDAPALTKILLESDFAGDTSEFIMGLATAEASATLDDLQTYLTPNKKDSGSCTVGADANSPDGLAQFTTGQDCFWALTNLDSYVGRKYLIYAYYKNAAKWSYELTMLHAGREITSNIGSLPAQSNYAIHCLGLYDIPEDTLIPGKQFYPSSDYLVGFTGTGTGTLYLRALWLVPAEAACYISGNIPDYMDLCVDGILPAVYSQIYTGGNDQYVFNHLMLGDYIELTPERYNRIYFYWLGTSAASHQRDFSISMYQNRRYRALA